MPLLIVEYGADWCPGCVKAKPELIDLAKKYDAVFLYVETDKLTEKPEYICWSYIPKVAIFNHHKFYYFGPYDKDAVAEMVGELSWTLGELKKKAEGK